MAAVHGPVIAAHPSPFRPGASIARPSNVPLRVNPAFQVSSSTNTPAANPSGSKPSLPADPFYGHETTAKLCARFVTHLFTCPDYAPATTTPSAPSPPLANFIAYALHRTRLHPTVTFAALYLLQRLKSRFPAARGSSGHRLFISAFMIASKVICDDTYSNKSWCIVGQGMFALREINQMEREMCSYLEWELNVEPSLLKDFEVKVKKDFAGPGPYPTYSVPPPFASQATQTQAPDVHAPPLVPFTHEERRKSPSSEVSSNPLPPPPVPIPTPYEKTYLPYTPPLTPDTPSSMCSDMSEMSSSPPTPPDGADIIVDRNRFTKLPLASEEKVRPADAALKVLPKSKIGREAFAFAAPAVW
ncbi:hypothetical protein NEOLEDRAFT_1069288 [Neolentinus lepideus HHB14362 ss-1]|uniref:Cyclin N-terminal domain-containing protein n=1 Tax=Neolentinus lepideus HHB14362 ss-1 TaxID=1314782 RepID=A0A165R9R7_9AGAM|nr:hypothetical protein NEOLEDRAFT_1069288 [Neolentinus lepideus HHB14362 ss-1]